ncbi:MAG: Do family serine endopeptidase [Parvularculaceae bacterium]|nr:Do family serine endopeptidase [Parvularculaceae bacterium]
MMRSVVSAAAAATAALALGASAVAVPTRGAPESFADLAETLTPAVVNISTAQRVGGSPVSGELAPLQKKFSGPRAASLGSGFIISPNGIVVTNNHVIDNADEIAVTLSDGREFKATVRGVDRETDIAVLQLEAPGVRFPAVSFGDSSRARVGDWVIAIGNPFGLGGTVTVGIVSARNRDIDAGNFDDFIQTDAAINRGNSGGPLFDMTGKVVGINTAIYSQTGGSVGVGFAVPSELADLVVEQLLQYGETRRGWLGVSIDEMTPKLAAELGLDRPRGAVVSSVRPGSPAALGGVLPSDVILSFNRKPVTTVRDLTRAVAETPVGTTAQLSILRAKKPMQLAVKLDRRETRVSAKPNDALPAGAVKSAGLTLQKPTPEVISAFGLSANVEGVVVTAVDPDSPAARVLRPGDVILEVGWERALRPDAAADKLAKLRNLNSGPVQIFVQRGDLAFYEQLQP